MPAPSARIVDAVIDLVGEHGVEGVSVRAVATRAGVSVGAVQHHFPTKAAMLLAANERIGAVVVERVQSLLARARTPATALRSVTRTLAALEPDERAATAVWVAFVSHALTDELAAERHRRDWQQVEDVFARLLAEHHGATPARTTDAAARLLALVDGIAIAVAAEPVRMTPRRARAIVDAAVDEALDTSPPPRAPRHR
ncbi:MAG: TetR/AcrR family transcriptional regulator [Dermatophilaceae bacterium]